MKLKPLTCKSIDDQQVFGETKQVKKIQQLIAKPQKRPAPLVSDAVWHQDSDDYNCQIPTGLRCSLTSSFGRLPQVTAPDGTCYLLNPNPNSKDY